MQFFHVIRQSFKYLYQYIKPSIELNPPLFRELTVTHI